MWEVVAPLRITRFTVGLASPVPGPTAQVCETFLTVADHAAKSALPCFPRMFLRWV